MTAARQKAEDAPMADEKHAERGTRILPAVVAAGIAVAIAVGIVAYAAGHYGERTTTVTTQAAPSTTSPVTYPTVSPQVAAGAHTFVQFACAQCHGMQGSGGVDPAVPALKTVGQSLTVAQLTHIIDHGLGEPANPKVPYMPVWGEVLSKTQVSNLVAYIRAGLPSVADTQPVSVPPGPGLPPRLPHRQGDRGRDPQRQRDRACAHREHAALGRDPLRPADLPAHRVPQDAEVAACYGIER